METSETDVAKRTLALAAERGLDGAGLRTLLVDPMLLKTPARLRVDPQNKTLLTEPLDLLGTDTPGLSMST